MPSGRARSTGRTTSWVWLTERTRSERLASACNAPRRTSRNVQLSRHATAPDVSARWPASAFTPKRSLVRSQYRPPTSVQVSLGFAGAAFFSCYRRARPSTVERSLRTAGHCPDVPARGSDAAGSGTASPVTLARALAAGRRSTRPGSGRPALPCTSSPRKSSPPASSRSGLLVGNRPRGVRRSGRTAQANRYCTASLTTDVESVAGCGRSRSWRRSRLPCPHLDTNSVLT